MSFSPVQSPKGQPQVDALAAPAVVTSKAALAAAEVLKPKADMVEKTMKNIRAQIQLGDEQAQSVSQFLGAVKVAVEAIRLDSEEVDVDPIAEAYGALEENVDAGTLTRIVNFAKGMAAANILKKGSSTADLLAYVKEQVKAENPLFTFLANPQAPEVVEERPATPPVVIEQQKEVEAPKAGLSTTTKVVLAAVALTGLAFAAYKYATPYFFPTAAVEQQPEAPVLPPVIEQVAQQTVSTIADTVSQVAQQVASTIVDTGSQVAQQVASTIVDTGSQVSQQAASTVADTVAHVAAPMYEQGTFFQAVNSTTTPVPGFVDPSTTCPAPVVQSVVDCAVDKAAQLVSGNLSFEFPRTFDTITPTEFAPPSQIVEQNGTILDTIGQGVANVTGLIADTASSLHAAAVQKAPIIGQAEAWVAQLTGDVVQLVQTQAPVVKDQVVQFAGAVGEAVKTRTLEALGYAHTQLPGSVSAQGYTVDIASGLDQAADAVVAAQDEHVGAGVLGTATLATLWGVKKLKNAVCGRTAAPPAPPIHAGAAFNIGAFPNGRGTIQQIKNLLKGNGVPAATVDGNWNGVKAVLVQNGLLPQAGRNRGTLARANAQQAVQVVQAAIAAGQIA